MPSESGDALNATQLPLESHFPGGKLIFSELQCIFNRGLDLGRLHLLQTPQKMTRKELVRGEKTNMWTYLGEKSFNSCTSKFLDSCLACGVGMKCFLH